MMINEYIQTGAKMSNVLAKLKKSSKTNLENIRKKIKEDDYANSYRDERYWQPVVDKSNNGNATIRFLPPITEPTENVPVPEDVPYVKIFKHGFKGPGGWYIENSLTTLGKNDPIGEYNSALWNSGVESKKKLASKQKRRLMYIMNILVVKHAAKQEDEGKVFLYACPKTIYDKIMSKYMPEEDDIEPVDVFDLWEGCNLRLRIRDKEGFRNYDTSEWDAPKPISDDDDDIERIYNSAYSLKAEVAPDKFKSYDELGKQLDRALGKNGGVAVDDSDEEDEAPAKTTKAKTKPVVDEDDEGEVVAPPKKAAKPVVEDDEDEDDNKSEADFFAKLAKRKK
jgi:hypothetical protein